MADRSREIVELFENLPGWRAGVMTDAGGGRGVFSSVIRVEVEGPPETPSSVVVKLAATGPNGEAGRAMGAYEREALAYETILNHEPPAHPICYLVQRDDHRGAAFVLEDLTGHRVVDQLDGLTPDDAGLVVDALASLHHRFHSSNELDSLPVRRSAPAGFGGEALQRGLEAVANLVEGPRLRSLQALVERRAVLVEAFSHAPRPTLCHGDPRADNLVFSDQGAVLFDWQQIAVQLGEADLAWMMATSLDVDDRREADRKLVARYGRQVNVRQVEGETTPPANNSFDRYRLGMVLPGLAVLLLAQREATDSRTAKFITASVERIAAAVDDLEIPDLRNDL
jgi:aminoglycoside phosphotransferase (APT) family kinase protein